MPWTNGALDILLNGILEGKAKPKFMGSVSHAVTGLPFVESLLHGEYPISPSQPDTEWPDDDPEQEHRHGR